MHIALRGARSGALIATAVTAAAAVVVLLPGVAQASANDDFDSATVITALPFATGVDLVGATAAADDPSCTTDEGAASAWFDYTPTADGIVAVDLNDQGSTDIAIYTGLRGALKLVPDTCRSSYSDPDLVPVTAGTTYHIMVSADWVSGSPVRLTVEEVVPPANDDFADAALISAVPATGETRLAVATAQAGEPKPSCATRGGDPSAWFAFTAPRTESVVFHRTSYDYETALAVYTGDALGALTEVMCDDDGSGVVAVTAGQTYRIQLSNPFPESISTTFSLAVAPPLRPYFGKSLADPSTFDTITFTDQTYDDTGEPITRTEWDFADGTTATGRQVEHRYTVNGDYVVRMKVTSADGRTATFTRTVVVRTHDVRIASLKVPNRGRPGQTRSIEVAVDNERIPENATVTLYKGGPNGFTEIARATQYVPTRTVAFPFNYTFTPEDATVGRVTFRAVVTLADGVRDARPVDNEAIAPATTVLPAPLNEVI